MKDNEIQTGVLQAGFAYVIWGLLPIYWKFLGHVGPEEILANRVLWSFIFMLVLIFLTRKWFPFAAVLKGFKTNKKQLVALMVASILISINWYTYIWAVNHNHMVDSSLGYYINPLVSVLLGMFFLKEKLSVAQYLSFILAGIGVLILTVSYGQFPWVSIILALSFGFYGLAKKLIKVDSTIGLTLETMVMTPVALIYMISLFIQSKQSLFSDSIGTDLLLFGAGAASAVPLLYFAKGAQKIPLSMLGFLQYIAPTIMLILGIFVYGEHFTKIHLLSFLFIWTALSLYSFSRTRLVISLEARWKKRKSFEV